MSFYEYHVAPAPRKGNSAKGVKGGAAKFANAITELMNAMASDGWEYLRADTLPCEERQGLTGKTVKYHSMLVFRRPLEVAENTDPLLALPVPEDAPEDTPEEAETWQVPEPQDTELTAENQPETDAHADPSDGYAEECEQDAPRDRSPT